MHFAKFDLDSTLIDTENLIYLALAEQGYMINEDQHFDYNFHFIEGYAPPPDFQWDVFFYRLFTERFDELNPVDEYVETFLELVTTITDCPLHIVTCRPPGILMHHAVMSTLKRCFPNVDFMISMVKHGESKTRYMDCADIFFDDRRKTAIDMAMNGNIAVVRRRCWNKIPETPGIRVTPIDELDIAQMGPREIITFDNYEQVIESGLVEMIAPF